MNGRREMQALCRRLQVAGYEVRTTGGGHLRVDTPKGPCFLPSTPSDRRSLLNAERLLARMGAELGR